MKKVFVFFILLFTLLVITCNLLPREALAEGEFNSDFDVTYLVKDTGITEVTNKITLTNVFGNLYASSYSMVLDSIKPTNIKAYDINGQLDLLIDTKDLKTTITVNFKDVVVGKNKSRTFWISFDETSFAVRTGEVWEIAVPRIAENSSFNSYYVSLLIPEKFGQEAYISPTPRNKFTSNGYLYYKFNKEDVI